MNRLIHEKSPYLLQHAHNPVDWYPWGEEAFSKARREDKPIFLSVGYSTCHWCHVMERESFEDEETARVLNAHFVPIKVDREERPDVDRVYMTYVQAATGGGGWPMSVWLTPDLRPFVGGTYFPPEDRWGRPSFRSVLLKIAEMWRDQRDDVAAASGSALEQLRAIASLRTDAGAAPGESLLDRGCSRIQASYDPRYGGFGDAPKFPRPVVCNFMLRHYARTGDTDALEMTLHTLRKMADGGMHDHVGGGFHRYSTDARWHVPHFEKMLYDQAQLACSYLEAYQITHERLYADVARDILDYVLRDMTGPEGQFFSAEDADSPVAGNPAERSEGAFYVWEWREIAQALGDEDSELFCFHYGVERDGNAGHDPAGELRGQNVLIVSHALDETAARFGRSPQEVEELLARARAKLFDLRVRRPRPQRDDKALTAWNGLTISAFARAHQVLNDSRYLDAANRAALFVAANLLDPHSGRLFRRHRAGEAAIPAYLDDYAFLIQGLLDLYEAAFDVSCLTRAIALQKTQDALFWDEASGGYFSTTGGDPSILLRVKEDYDGAEPSGNSIAALNLLRLSEMTDGAEMRQKAERLLRAFGGAMERVPEAMPQMLVALGFHLGGAKRIVVAGRAGASDTTAMLREVHAHFIPNKVLLLADRGDGRESPAGLTESVRDARMLDGKATAYVCEHFVCQRPTNDAAQLASMIVRLER
jgi:uncharacterized protein